VSDPKQRSEAAERPTAAGQAEAAERPAAAEQAAPRDRARGLGETLGGVGETLGGFARRVGEFVGELPGQVAATVSPASAALEGARALRMIGALDAASEALRTLRVERPSEEGVIDGLRRVALLQAWLRGAPLAAAAWQPPATGDGGRGGDASGPGSPTRLLEDAWRAVQDEARGDAGAREGLDLARRVARMHDGLGAADRDELRLLAHLIAAEACGKLGALGRRVRELAKAQGRLAMFTTPTRAADDPAKRAPRGSREDAARDGAAAPNPLREAIMIRRGLGLLALDRVAEAELAWTRHLHETGELAAPGSEPTAGHLAPLRAARAAFTARLHAARGDAAAAALALRELDGDARYHGEAAALALALGDAATARREALAWLRESPTSPERMRAWALAELLTILDADDEGARSRARPASAIPAASSGVDPRTPTLPGHERELLRALVTACRCAPEGRRGAHRHELAFALLVLDAPVEAVDLPPVAAEIPPAKGTAPHARQPREASPIAAGDELAAALRELDDLRGADRVVPGTAGSEGPRPAELELVALRRELSRGRLGPTGASRRSTSGEINATPEDRTPGTTLAQRLGFDLTQRPVGLPPSLEAATHLPERDGVGPDESSPLRLPGVRARVLECHAHLLAAALAAAEGRHALADDLRVQALGVDPRSRSARAALEHLPAGDAGDALDDHRVETRLAVATERLADVPTAVAGVYIEGVEPARAGIVEARERLARPLTLAIMGEFSAGKSSVVNALLGESIAAVGALPTTATINLFRRGPTGTARVFHRDGTLSVVAADQIEMFLSSLDDVAAARIRHVEIERGEERLGDLTIVDTPGLNALDAYHERVAREFLDTADAVIWVSSATRTITASELRVLDELRAGGREVLAVLNKIDVIDAHERDELVAYVREQLAGRVVEVVPVSAERALAWRRDAVRDAGPTHRGGQDTAADAGADPFAALERALHTHCVARGRELKLALVERRLQAALAGALAGLHAAIASLEADARRALDDAALEHALRTVDAFERALDGELVTIADPLTRELLAVGAAVSGVGLGPSADDAADLAYLDARLGELLESAFDRAIASAARGGERVAVDLLARELGPWSRGYLAGLRHRGLLPELVRFAGPAAARGERELEAALTLRLRAATLPVLEATHRLRIPLAAEVRSARRRRASLPEAEALRLRARHVAPLEALARLAAPATS
jgi:GTP-binding protein EngB required for normal cell division